jgi:hypothetical protein
MAATVEAPPAAAPAARRRRRLRRLLAVVVAVALLPPGVEAYRVMFGANFHTVVPGRVYRCSQPSPHALKQMIAEHHIRTVVNLRGSCDPFPWYLDEARTTHRLNVSHEDICFSAGRLPSVSELRHLIEVLDRTAYPIVLHCRRGADRTGLAAAMVLLLQTALPLEDACGQLGCRYGHVAVGRTAQLDQFLVFYADWLKGHGQQHSPAVFRHWALHEYRPGSCWSELTFLNEPPAQVRRDASTALYLRVRNASLLPWRLRPLSTAGVHLGCHIYDDKDTIVDVVKSGLRDATVLPGASADFTLVVPPLRRPGRYRLQLDMVDEQQCWFYQTGSEPLEVELIVCD